MQNDIYSDPGIMPAQIEDMRPASGMMKPNTQFRKLCNGRDFIAANFSNSFDLAAAAKHSNLSPYHFSRNFKKTFDESPSAFLIRLRIEKAKDMLIKENGSVLEICERVGYTSLGSFSSLFHQRVGLSPLQYRRKLWNLSSEPFRYPLQAIPSCYAFRLLGAPVNAQYRRNIKATESIE